jgi:serine/threonine protein kinase/energy-coupling factor transporter ATP-binding protein EcfA2
MRRMVVGEESEGGFAGTPRFEIIRRIGAGGMGVVYEAYDREQRAPVALKVLRTLEPEALLRFKNEFRVLQDIRHPNLISLGELFEANGQWFFTMEMVHGLHFLDYLESTGTGGASGNLAGASSGRGDFSPHGGGSGPQIGDLRASGRMPVSSTPAIISISGRSSGSGSAITTTAVSSASPEGAEGGASPIALSFPSRDSEPGDEPTLDGSQSAPARTSQRVRRSRLRTEVDEQKLRSALGQLARGLHALHRAKKVHRDIKPSNILVTPEGRVVILDFGLVADLSAALSESYLVGTCWYMAPEQARLKPIGPPADWYSVGVLLYQALTGRLPVQGNAREVLFMKQVAHPPPPDSLAIVPEDLNRLCMDLLQIEPRDRPLGREVLRRLGAEEPSSLSEFESDVPHFVGRAAELTALHRAFVAATGGGWKDRSRCKTHDPEGRPLSEPRPDSEPHSGSGVTIFLHGESGVGKSALTRRFAEILAEDDPGTIVLSGRCYEREAVPYKAVDGIIDALSRALASLDQDEATFVLPTEVGLLGQVFPVMRRIEAVAQARSPQAGALDPQVLRGRLFQALRDLFTKLAERRPLVLTIDDLQWADGDSLALLAEITRPPGAPRLLLMATMRSALRTEASSAEGDAAAKSAPLRVQQLVHLFAGDVREMQIDALPINDARALVAALLRDAGGGAGAALSPEAVAEEAGGHPLFIDELVRRKLMAGGKADALRLEEALWARISELDPGVRHLLELIVVAGAPVVQETAARAARIEYSLFSERVSLLRAANLARTTGTRRADLVEPYHDRVREAVLLHLDQEVRRALHERLAVALEASEKADPEALAIHWREAGDLEKAAEHAARAAEDAERALAFDRAARLYQLSLTLRPDMTARGGALRAKLGDALVNAGRGADAAAAYLAAAPLVGPAEALELQRRAAEQLLRSGHIDEAMDAFQSVLEAIDMALPRTPKRALASLLFRRAQLRLRGISFRERDERDIPAADLARIDTCWSVAAGLGLVDTIIGSYFQSRCLLLALDAGEPHRVARALAMEASYTSAAGGKNHARTRKVIEITGELARKLDHPYAIAWASGAAGIAGCLEGRWKSGHESCEEAEAAFRDRCTGVYWEIGTMRWFSLWSQSYLGHLASLSKRIPARLREARERGDLYAAIGHSTGLANLVWLAADDPDEALERSREALRRWSQKTFHVEHWWAMLAERQIDLYVGDAEAAYKRVTEQWPALSGSLLLMVQLTRLESLQLRARCALMLARERPSEARALTRAAARDAEDIEEEKMTWATPLAALLRAGVASTLGDQDRAISLLRASVAGLDAADMGLYGASARYRMGQILGGDEGRELITAADLWMKSQGIVNSLRMVAMHAPGFPD